MSTKIYNGYVIPKMQTLDEFYRFTQKVRSIIKKAIDDQFLDMLACKVAWILDEQSMGKDIPKEFQSYSDKNVFSFSTMSLHISDKIREAEKSASHTEYPDYKFEVCFFPRRNKILCMVFTEMRDIQNNVWENIDGVEEYAYWDNSDPPEGMSYSNFKKRGKEWDNALGNNGYGVPSMNSIIIDCVGGYMQLPNFFCFDKEEYKKRIERDILPRIPSFEKRVGNQAEEVLFRTKLQRFEDSLKDENGNIAEDKRHLLMDYYYEYRNFLTSPEGEKALNDMKKEVSEKIRKTISIGDMCRSS